MALPDNIVRNSSSFRFGSGIEYESVSEISPFLQQNLKIRLSLGLENFGVKQNSLFSKFDSSWILNSVYQEINKNTSFNFQGGLVFSGVRFSSKDLDQQNFIRVLPELRANLKIAENSISTVFSAGSQFFVDQGTGTILKIGTPGPNIFASFNLLYTFD